MTDTLDLTDVDLWRDLHMDDEVECNTRAGHDCMVEATWLRITCDSEEVFWCNARKRLWDQDLTLGIACGICGTVESCGQLRPI